MRVRTSEVACTKTLRPELWSSRRSRSASRDTTTALHKDSRAGANDGQRRRSHRSNPGERQPSECCPEQTQTFARVFAVKVNNDVNVAVAVTVSVNLNVNPTSIGLIN